MNVRCWAAWLIHFLFIAICIPAQAGNKPPDTQSVQELLNGFANESVFGTIVTDGTIGVLGIANLLDVSLTATNGVANFSLSSVPSSFSGVSSIGNSLVYSGDVGTELLFMEDGGGTNTLWQLSPSSTPGNVLKTIFVDGSGGSEEVAAPYTFANAIPEPSSFILALGALCLAMGRRRI